MSPTAHDTLRRMHFGQNQASPAALGQLEFVRMDAHMSMLVHTYVCVANGVNLVVKREGS